MKAKLVTFDIMVRVVVPETATDYEITQLACEKLRAMHGDFAENVANIVDDVYVPAGVEDGIEAWRVAKEGTLVDHWPCDYYEPNDGHECIVLFMGAKWSVKSVIDYDPLEKLFKPFEKIQPIDND